VVLPFEVVVPFGVVLATEVDFGTQPASAPEANKASAMVVIVLESMVMFMIRRRGTGGSIFSSLH
jgi:hypothetical protein